MKLVSVNVSFPVQVDYRGKTVTTGIFKKPVNGQVKLRKHNLEGDKQADLAVHGGVDKAVYAYPAEHYPYWKRVYPDIDMPWGMFGENFTTEGLLEDDVRIGDKIQIGSTEVMVTQPRSPCYKLGIKFGRSDVIKKFLVSGRSGIYFRVLKEGELQVGEEIKLVKKDENNVTVKDIVRLYTHNIEDNELMQRAMRVEALPEGWKDYFRQQITHNQIR